MRQLLNRIAGAAAALGLACALGLPAGAAVAQPRLVPIPPKAQRADITFNGSPDILINGKIARLAPGARIVGRNNMLVLSGSLSGTATAKYLIEDGTGNVIGVWILTDEEIATPDPDTK